MKKKQKRMLLCFGILLCLLGTGCEGSDTSGGTIAEPELTVAYLSTDYAEQLVRDGGEHFFGTLTVRAEDNGAYSAQIRHKKLVKSDSHKKGYYIADRNLETTLPCSPQARITYITKDGAAPEVITMEEWMRYTSDLSGSVREKDAEQSRPEKLYDIYEIGGTIELILEKDLNEQ